MEGQELFINDNLQWGILPVLFTYAGVPKEPHIALCGGRKTAGSRGREIGGSGDRVILESRPGEIRKRQETKRKIDRLCILIQIQAEKEKKRKKKEAESREQRQEAVGTARCPWLENSQALRSFVFSDFFCDSVQMLGGMIESQPPSTERSKQ